MKKSIFVSWSAPSMGARLSPLVASSNAEELRKLARHIEDANDACWVKWAEQLGGVKVVLQGATGTVEVPLSALPKIETQQERYAGELGCPVFVGAAPVLAKATRALTAATKQGIRTPLLYSPDLEKVLAEDKLEKAEVVAPTPPKAEASEHSEGEAAAAQATDTSGTPPPPEMTHAEGDLTEKLRGLAQQPAGQPQGMDRDKLKQEIVKVLLEVKQQAPFFGQLKAANPQAFSTLQNLINGVIELARALNEPMKKSEGPLVRRPMPWAGSYDWHDGHTDHHVGLMLTKNDPKHPHMDGPPVAPGAAPHPTNDQAAGKGVATYAQYAQHFGEIKPNEKTDLLHYDYHGKLPAIQQLVKDHGFQVYYAGGAHGKPDLANKNYNTNHLMVYDPTPQSGGDFGERDYTDAWRQIHELSHALAYKDLNQIYGEGRRIGKLGTHRTLNEAQRAVHWEWLAGHKQRELSAQIGVHVPDHLFNKEMNCLDDETEALTQRGWIKGFDLCLDDILLTKNPKTGILEWQNMTDLKLYPDHEGEVVEFKTKTFCAVTTPDHRWLVTTNGGVVRERTSSTVVLRGDRIHRTGKYAPVLEGSVTGDQAELLGWFVTDGAYKINKTCNGKYTGRNGVKYAKPGTYAQLCQSVTGNPQKCARIDALLRRLDQNNEVCRPSPSKGSAEQIWNLGPTLTALMLDLAPRRSLEISSLLTFDTEALGRLREAMVLGDGNVSKSGQETLVTGRKEQAEAFQVLLTMTGSASSMVWRDMSMYSPVSDKLKNIPKSAGCWVVSALRREYAQLAPKDVSRRIAKVPVWCPVVPNTFFVARRKGKVWITGNTVMHDAVHRAVTGKFTEPSEEGFSPHSHLVPLETSLGLVRQAADQMGLKSPHETLTKKSEAALEKALSDVPVGTSAGGSTFGIKGVYNNTHDYSHLLSPQHKAAGYQLLVHDDHDGNEAGQLHAELKQGNAGNVGNIVFDVDSAGKSMSPADANLSAEHRGGGLGTAMYEAAMAHGKNKLGLETMKGGIHSSMAGAVHQRLSQKHGMSYAPTPNLDRDPVSAAKKGAYDNAHAPYEYALKNEISMEKDEGVPQRHHLVLPPGTIKEGGPGGDRNSVGRVKVQHGDGSTSWVQARAGMISAVADRHAKPLLGHAAHPLSSRNPTGR